MRALILIIISCTLGAYAQFDPAGGELGSKSIHRDHSSIISWAIAAQLERGFQQINDTSLGKVSVGTSSDATGSADGSVVSLGDGGQIVLTFKDPIYNSEGYDFAVFENGFKVGLSYFLELAHVEVSADGENYVRFPSETTVDIAYQINNFSYLNPEQIYNLAGKHQAPYGTLFDLEEVGLTSVTHIRLIDVIGSITDSLGSKDSKGRIINDPWPSPFESGGFDLDAVAVVDGTTLSLEDLVDDKYMVYPTLASPFQTITTTFPQTAHLAVYDVAGALVASPVASQFYLERPGVYFLRVSSNGQFIHRKIIIQ